MEPGQAPEDAPRPTTPPIDVRASVLMIKVGSVLPGMFGLTSIVLAVVAWSNGRLDRSSLLPILVGLAFFGLSLVLFIGARFAWKGRYAARTTLTMCGALVLTALLFRRNWHDLKLVGCAAWIVVSVALLYTPRARAWFGRDLRGPEDRNVP